MAPAALGDRTLKLSGDRLAEIIVLGLSFFIMFVWEPGMLFDRVPAPEQYRREATPPRLNDWNLQAERVNVYFVDHWYGMNPATDRCFYAAYPTLLSLLRSPDIYVYIGGLSQSDYRDRLADCYAHEVGHYIDQRNGWISNTHEFQREVMDSLILLNSLPEGGEIHWRGTAHWIATFPGVNGNPLEGGTWGGYRELYAELHQVTYLIQIPPPLQHYFKDFLYWSWNSLED